MRVRTLRALQAEGYSGQGEITILSDGAEILKRASQAIAQADNAHHRLVSHRYEDPTDAADRRSRCEGRDGSGASLHRWRVTGGEFQDVEETVRIVLSFRRQPALDPSDPLAIACPLPNA
jgi:hypothetical protein